MESKANTPSLKAKKFSSKDSFLIDRSRLLLASAKGTEMFPFVLLQFKNTKFGVIFTLSIKKLNNHERNNSYPRLHR